MHIKNIIFVILSFILQLSAFSQAATDTARLNRTNTYITLGSCLMASGVIMSQSTSSGNRVGIPCFAIGISIFSIAKDKRNKIKSNKNGTFK